MPAWILFMSNGCLLLAALPGAAHLELIRRLLLSLFNHRECCRCKLQLPGCSTAWGCATS